MSSIVGSAQLDLLTLLLLQVISPGRKIGAAANWTATMYDTHPLCAERALLTTALQIDAATQKDGGFKFTAINGAPSQKEPQHMALLAMELHSE